MVSIDRTVSRPPRSRDEKGHFLPTFTLAYDTDEGRTTRPGLAASGVEAIGMMVAGKAGRDAAWNIEVLDSAGNDVTAEFVVFQDL